jgi:hypothetical protein
MIFSDYAPALLTAVGGSSGWQRLTTQGWRNHPPYTLGSENICVCGRIIKL